MARELSFVQSVERSISKTYRERLWTPFITAIKNYKLIEEGDKIAVCISGGKDSMLMAKLIQMLHRHSDVKFDVEYLVMDPGYNEINRQKIESNAKLRRTFSTWQTTPNVPPATFAPRCAAATSTTRQKT